MHSLLHAIPMLLWAPFTYWTIRRLSGLRNQPSEREIYRYGIMGFGVSSWIAAVILGLAFWPTDAERPPIYKVVYLAYLLLPACLWCGFYWGKIMVMFSSRMRNL